MAGSLEAAAVKWADGIFSASDITALLMGLASIQNNLPGEQTITCMSGAKGDAGKDETAFFRDLWVLSIFVSFYAAVFPHIDRMYFFETAQRA